MKKVSVIVKDKNTLVLNEDASKGDFIDLTELSSIDTSSLEETIERGADKVYAERLKQARAQFDFQKKAELEKLSLQNQSEVKQLKSTIEQISSQAENEKRLAVNDALAKKNAEIAELNEKIAASDSRIESEIAKFQLKSQEALSLKEKEIMRLSNELDTSKKQAEINESNMKAHFDEQLKAKDEQIGYYKDLKARMSTKMIGETLEIHCRTSFEQYARPLMPNAYFEKDNDAKSGSKGDFIFRDYADGVEYISIMFEMKNEADTTATKHKNEDFFKELDKDRKEKKCEFAVLVSLLEGESDLYNGGIVDVSHKYEKMYVIRPQFFIPIITLLCNASKKSLDYKKQLVEAKNQSIDITNFEKGLTDFKESFGRNYRIASEKFEAAIDEIDKSISHLQKIKEALLGSKNNMRLANDKLTDLTIKKLAKNSPSIRGLFDDM